ncbi:DEAD/DEAH box helicase [Stenoxybacter acetivorans]|uniref:DEAD/DEAH box helicase n=1 Tax=Stenoxybacter acetivorans TaxID=422441 RepID=UPI0006899632|nr:DEAD/DEAH box helicase [Stenoxybacter acetivorans]
MQNPVLNNDEIINQSEAEAQAESEGNSLPLAQFLNDFGDSLFHAVTAQNQPLYTSQIHAKHEAVMDGLSRRLFPAQRDTVRAVNQLLFTENQPAAVINAEMGTGKTMMAIAAAAVAYAEGYPRTLVLSPPHLVYKWRREILKTIPEARVWVLNGADTLTKLLCIRAAVRERVSVPEFFILGRVRMRMGFHWQAAYAVRYQSQFDDDALAKVRKRIFCCPKCGGEICDSDNHAYDSEDQLRQVLSNTRSYCQHKTGKNINASRCGEPLWTLCRKNTQEAPVSVYDRVLSAISRLPTVGKKTAEKLIHQFGEQMLAEILENNIQSFANLMDDEGEFIFNERQASRLDRALSRAEFSLGQGGYQPTEFIKRYLPKNFFGLMVIDEGHEYKNYGTAQGQAMGVLARCAHKKLCLTGTLMGGYADDLFYLLWRLNPQLMLEDGFAYNKSGTLGTAGMAFMRQHGVLKDIIKTRTGNEYSDGSFSSSRASRNQVRTAKAPGFSPLGIMRYVLPITVFLKLRDLGEGVLPGYQEIFRSVEMTEAQAEVYRRMKLELQAELRAAVSKGDNTLTGVVTNALLAWPDCGDREETVIWKRYKQVLFQAPALFGEDDVSPKEADVLAVVQDALAKNRRVLVYTVYSDTRDTTARLKHLFERHGIKAAVLRASVKADQREDWVSERLDEGCQVVISNPELVKTGLDLLQFPTIYFMQTGYNVYTLMQAARRSWRIGQTEPVEVYFGGYMNTAQQICLELMAKKIAVAQSTSGDMPDTGLDILNSAEDSVEVQLAKRLVAETV